MKIDRPIIQVLLRRFPERWDTRSHTVQDYSYREGVCLETIVDLANFLHPDLGSHVTSSANEPGLLRQARMNVVAHDEAKICYEEI